MEEKKDLMEKLHGKIRRFCEEFYRYFEITERRTNSEKKFSPKNRPLVTIDDPGKSSNAFVWSL